MKETEKGRPYMGDLFFWMLCGTRPLGGNTFMIREHHAFRNTDKEWCDLVLVYVAFRRRHDDDSHGWFAIEEAGEQREIVVVS